MANHPTVLLLGASQDQLFALRTAREMGLRTLAVDMNPDSPGFALADEHAVVSTRDVPALKALCDASRQRGHPVAGVLVMGSDIPLVVAELTEYLGLPGVSRHTAALATDKYRMKVRFAEAGIPLPWFSLVDSPARLRRFVEERGYPLILKPTDRSGARGVFRLVEGCDLDALFAASRAQSFCGQVMVESYLPGPQISTETIMWRGRGHTVGFADRNYEMLERFAPSIIENGGTVPTALSPAQRRAVEETAERAALALGIENGVAKGDLVLTPEGPKVVEIAARLSGGDFSESLIPLGCGVNIVRAALQIAIGQPPDLAALKPQWERAVVNRYFFPEPGRLVAVRGAETVRDQPWLRKLEFWRQPGEVLPAIKSHGDRFGVFIVVGETPQEAEERARQVYRAIAIITEPA